MQQSYITYCFFGFSISRYLDNQDVQLLKPICKALGIPIDPPVEVIVKKSALKEDPQTGRQIEYKGLMAPTPSSSCSAFVSLNSVPEFGQIESFFVYRSTQFVIIKKFHHPTICSYGLIVIPDRTSTTREIVALDKLSPPLVVACSDKELWILNHPPAVQ